MFWGHGVVNYAEDGGGFRYLASNNYKNGISILRRTAWILADVPMDVNNSHAVANLFVSLLPTI